MEAALTDLTCHLRALRERAGLSQAALAARVGVSRQAIVAIEAGRQVPSTTLALALAATLGVRVEEVFALPTPRIGARGAPGHPGARVLLGAVRGDWVAHALDPWATGRAADGLVGEDGRVELLVDPDQARRTVLVAGCAPLLGPLAGRTRGVRATWLPASSGRALDLLAEGRVHVAGLHLAGDPDANVRAVRARFPGRPMTVVHLTRWRQGLVVASGNPHGVGAAEDLVQPGLRLVHRDPGAGASKLLAALVPEGLPDGPRVGGHEAVAELIRLGAADAGVAVEAVALAAGLDFVPLSEERFDLVVPGDLVRDPAVVALLDALEDRAFRAEARRLPGYDLGLTGAATALEAP